MKFGFDLYLHFGTDLSGPRAFEYAIRQVRAARDAGFDGIFASHHYALGPNERMFQQIPLLARLAAEARGFHLRASAIIENQDSYANIRTPRHLTRAEVSRE